jgi:signal transduction histidine kinase
MRGVPSASHSGRRPLTRLTAEFYSLKNRLALLIFAVTLIAVGAMYAYVSLGLRQHVVNARLHDLAHEVRTGGRSIGTAVDTRNRSTGLFVKYAGQLSNDRVQLLTVVAGGGSGNPQFIVLDDSSETNAATPLNHPTATDAVRTLNRLPASKVPSNGLVLSALTSGTELTPAGLWAEASVPVMRQGRLVNVIVYSTPISDLEHSISTIRRQILVAGGIALLLALMGGYLTALWLARRVKRLERAAERVAAGEFTSPMPVDSRDELGQLTIAFNDMQRQLGQLDRARKQFIATASHELRTPVFSLGGFVELLEDDDLDTETRKRFLGHVSEQVERLHKLSVNLLDLSRLESGALELRPEQVDLAELASSVSAEFELALAERASEVELHVTAGTEAQCDPVRLAQIVRILIDNALHHNSAGVRITVDASRVGSRLLVSVKDDGEGIDRSAMTRIFEPFFTADDARGSGLGLAIASELAERMDGRLTVTSRPGETIFRLELPAGDTGIAAAELAEPNLA